jgi:predicted RNase H-like nuclease (RuvC/YqgF family)
MIDAVDTPTPEAPGGNVPTPEPKTAEAKKLEFTQDELDRKFADRQKRGEEAAAKRYQKQIDELTAQIDEFKSKDLGELEKLQKKLEKATQALAEKDQELTGLKLKDAKVEALLMAGATSDQIPKLLKRVSGTTPEEIAGDVGELKELGWIGKQEPPAKGANGSGHQLPKDSGAAKSYTRSQLKALSKDPDAYEKERESIMKAMQEGRIKDE